MRTKQTNKYLYFILTTFISTAVLIGVAIFYIVYTTFSTEKESSYEKAFKWQIENRGVVGITVNISSEYKQRMLEWRIAKKDIDTILLGSSTMMGIKESMFGKYKVFNGATNSNILYYTIAVAKYHSKHSDNIKNVMIGFDWALGLPYWPYKKINHNPIIKKKKEIKTIDKIKDAVTYQRVKIVVSNLLDTLFSERIPQYTCPTEQTIGTDQFFKTDQPKRCSGFRFDGSVIFPNQTRVSEKKWKEYLESGLEKYQKYFDTNLGTIDTRYLSDLKEIDRELKKKGGGLMILIPPLIPNATVTIEKKAKQMYSQKLSRLTAFTKENNITLMNTSKSEKFGCVHNDFLDPHHAFPACYEKIFKNLSL